MGTGALVTTWSPRGALVVAGRQRPRQKRVRPCLDGFDVFTGLPRYLDFSYKAALWCGGAVFRGHFVGDLTET